MCKPPKRNTRRIGFTMLELQVAVILLTFGIVTMASLLTTQQRTLKRLRGDFVPASTLYVIRSNDPWEQQLQIPARITSAPFAQGVPASVVATQTVTLVSVQQGLTGETLTVTADTALIP